MRSARARAGITERLARACSDRPRRALAVWGVAIVAAIALAATSLHGLTSTGSVTGNPESAQAAAAISTAFPLTPAQLRRQSSDVVIVSSDRYLASSAQFQAFVAHLVDGLHATGTVRNLSLIHISDPRD